MTILRMPSDSGDSVIRERKVPDFTSFNPGYKPASFIVSKFLIFRNLLDTEGKSPAYHRRPVPPGADSRSSRHAGRDAMDAAGR